MRAAIASALADDAVEVVVLDAGPVEGVLDDTDVKGLRIVDSEAALAREVEAACLTAARADHDSLEDGAPVVRQVLVVVPGGAARVLPEDPLRAGLDVRAVALGGDEPPVVVVEEDGAAVLPDGTRGRLPVMAPVAQPAVEEEDNEDWAGPLNAAEGPPLEDAASISEEDRGPDAPGGPAAAAADGGRTLVELLGGSRIVVGGREIRSGLRKKARELLTLLAARPEGVTRDAAIEALFPDADNGDKAAEKLRQAAKDLRRIFRPLEAPEGAVIDRDGPRLRLTDRLPNVDVREFIAAARAAEAGDADAAERAVALYRGELAEGYDYPWAAAERRRLELLLLTAVSRHAKARVAAGDLAAAEAAINRALAIDPHSEPTYRDLMVVLRRQGREDAVRRTYARVEGVLAEIGLTPEPATTALLNGDEPGAA